MIGALSGLTDLFSKGGIGPSQIMTLISGKATKKQVSEIITPLLIKYTPFVGKAIAHKEAELKQGQVAFVITMGENEKKEPVETVSICTVDDEGVFTPQESFPLYELVDYIIKSLDATPEATTIELNAEPTKQLPA